MQRKSIIVLISILILCSLLTAAFCVASGYFLWTKLIGPPPREGPKAEAGYKAAAPIIDALERYKTVHNAYPVTLDTLVPDYLPNGTANPEDFAFDYQVKGASYELMFRYAGLGMNVCTYTPEKGWYCYGYY